MCSIKNAIAALALCLLCTCSNTCLAYTWLDWLIPWYLADYLSLNDRQNDFYKQRLKALLQWHRKDQLVLYSRFADQLQHDMRGQLSPALLKERFDSLKQFWRTCMEHAAPDCAGLLLMLDREQRLGLYAAVEKKQKDLEIRYRSETPDQRKARHLDQAEKPFKRFFGSLTVPQKAILVCWVENLVPLQSLWLENRRSWQKCMRAALEGNEPDAEKRRLLERLFIEPEHVWTSAYRHAMNLNETATLAMLADLLATLTEKQQQHVQNTLETLQKDFNILSKQ